MDLRFFLSPKLRLGDEWKQQGVSLSGNVLAIYDSSDEYAGSSEGFFAFSEGNRLGQHSELVLHVGTGHGILYEPLSEWVLPTVRWASQEWQINNSVPDFQSNCS